MRNQGKHKLFVKDIGEIRSGYLFTRKIVPQKNGNVRVAQLKDVDDTFGLNEGKLASVMIEKTPEDLFLRKGDVLFKSKSLNHVACSIEQDFDSPVLPTAHFFIVRPAMKGVLPAYLAWYINRSPAQQYFETVSAGSAIPFVNKKALGKLEIPVPSLRVQEEALEMHGLFLQEKGLMVNLMNKRESLITGALLKIIETYPAQNEW